MQYIGDFRTGKIIRKLFSTNAAAGESITIATNGTISVYKDGGLTQSVVGVTFTEDFDGLTGVHLVAVDTSADGTFYSAGSDFEVVLSGATIDGKAVNAPLFSFSLENRSALMPTTDGRKLTVEADGMGHADVKEIEGADATTYLEALDNAVLAVLTVLGTPAGASLAADIAAIEAQTDDIGAAGAGLTALPTMTTQMVEAYAADGTAPTPAQALFLIMQRLTEFSRSGATITVKKLDGTTAAATLTLDSATAPTSSTRSG